LLGVDYGGRRIGLAVSDVERRIASPLAVFHRQPEAGEAAAFRQLVSQYEIVGIVVGLPLHLSGDEGGKAQEARGFGRWLGKATGLPVCFWDERLTTATAHRIMKAAGLKAKARKDRLDAVAAQILLQSYLDAGCPAGEGAVPLEEEEVD